MISKSDKLFFPSIGFRAISAVEELTNLKEKRSYNEFILKDVYGIAVYCESVLNREFNPTMLGDAYHVLMLEDLEGLMKNLDREEILKERISQVKNTRLTLEKVTKGENISQEEIDGGIKFFEGLSRKCKEYMEDYSQI